MNILLTSTPYRACSLVLLFAFTACSGSEDTRTSVRKVVGSEGGELELAGVASLDVPSGALSENTNLEMEGSPSIGVAGLADPPEGAELRSEVATFRPHGLSFQKPVQVEMDHEPSESGVGNLVVGTLEDDQDQTWERVPDVDFEGGVASFQINGFSHYAVFEDTLGNLRGIDPGMGSGGADDGTGGMDGGGGNNGTGGDVGTGGTGGDLGSGGTGGDVGGSGGTGGDPGLGSTEEDLGAFQSGTMSGRATALASGSALIQSIDGAGEPFCATADIVTDDGTSSLAIRLSLNEDESGVGTWTPANEAGKVEIKFSAPGLFKNLGVKVRLISDTLVYSRAQTPLSGVATYTLDWTLFTAASSSYDGRPLKYIEFAILDEWEESLLGQELCVHGIVEK